MLASCGAPCSLPANSPFMDDRIVYAPVLVAWALAGAGPTWLRRYPALR